MSQFLSCFKQIQTSVNDIRVHIDIKAVTFTREGRYSVGVEAVDDVSVGLYSLVVRLGQVLVSLLYRHAAQGGRQLIW